MFASSRSRGQASSLCGRGCSCSLVPPAPVAPTLTQPSREFLIDNLLVRIHFVTELIQSGLAPRGLNTHFLAAGYFYLDMPHACTCQSCVFAYADMDHGGVLRKARLPPRHPDREGGVLRISPRLAAFESVSANALHRAAHLPTVKPQGKCRFFRIRHSFSPSGTSRGGSCLLKIEMEQLSGTRVSPRLLLETFPVGLQ